MRSKTTRFGPPDRDPVGVSRSGAGTMMGSDAVVALNCGGKTCSLWFKPSVDEFKPSLVEIRNAVWPSCMISKR